MKILLLKWIDFGRSENWSQHGIRTWMTPSLHLWSHASIKACHSFRFQLLCIERCCQVEEERIILCCIDEEKTLLAEICTGWRHQGTLLWTKCWWHWMLSNNASWIAKVLLPWHWQRVLCERMIWRKSMVHIVDVESNRCYFVLQCRDWIFCTADVTRSYGTMRNGGVFRYSCVMFFWSCYFGA